MNSEGKRSERIVSLYVGKKVNGATLWRIYNNHVIYAAVGGFDVVQLSKVLEQYYPTRIVFGMDEDSDTKDIIIPSYTDVKRAHYSWEKAFVTYPTYVWSAGNPQKKSYRIGWNEIISRGEYIMSNTNVFLFNDMWFEKETYRLGDEQRLRNDSPRG